MESWFMFLMFLATFSGDNEYLSSPFQPTENIQCLTENGIAGKCVLPIEDVDKIKPHTYMGPDDGSENQMSFVDKVSNLFTGSFNSEARSELFVQNNGTSLAEIELRVGRLELHCPPQSEDIDHDHEVSSILHVSGVLWNTWSKVSGIFSPGTKDVNASSNGTEDARLDELVRRVGRLESNLLFNPADETQVTYIGQVGDLFRQAYVTVSGLLVPEKSESLPNKTKRPLLDELKLRVEKLETAVPSPSVDHFKPPFITRMGDFCRQSWSKFTKISISEDYSTKPKKSLLNTLGRLVDILLGKYVPLKPKDGIDVGLGGPCYGVYYHTRSTGPFSEETYCRDLSGVEVNCTRACSLYYLVDRGLGTNMTLYSDIVDVDQGIGGPCSGVYFNTRSTWNTFYMEETFCRDGQGAEVDCGEACKRRGETIRKRWTRPLMSLRTPDSPHMPLRRLKSPHIQRIMRRMESSNDDGDKWFDEKFVVYMLMALVDFVLIHMLMLLFWETFKEELTTEFSEQEELDMVVDAESLAREAWHGYNLRLEGHRWDRWIDYLFRGRRHVIEETRQDEDDREVRRRSRMDKIIRARRLRLARDRKQLRHEQKVRRRRLMRERIAARLPLYVPLNRHDALLLAEYIYVIPDAIIGDRLLGPGYVPQMGD